MNRRGMACVAFAAVLALAGLVGCSREEESAPAATDGYVFAPLRVASAYTALLEKPDAECVLLIGEEARRMTNVFTRSGMEVHLTPEGKFDLLVIACREMTKESCARACSHLTEDGVAAWLMDVRNVRMGQFERMISSFDLKDVHLWMLGAERWMLVGRKNARPVKLSAMLDLFAREGTYEDLAKAACWSLPEMFANYVGKREDILPAFTSGGRSDAVRPERFIPRQVPEIDWISREGTEEDIAKDVFAEIRSMQNVRRTVVEGDILSESATDKKGEEAAIDKWATALKRNPRDLFVLERLDRLDRNARGFLEVGKVLMAMKCFETMVLIRPNDARSVHNFGMCLKKIGKLDVAEKVLKRAETLANSAPKQ